jgi:hypothetical protein
MMKISSQKSCVSTPAGEVSVPGANFRMRVTAPFSSSRARIASESPSTGGMQGLNSTEEVAVNSISGFAMAGSWFHSFGVLLRRIRHGAATAASSIP